MLHWVTNCFSGWRGAIRWKAIIRGGRTGSVRSNKPRMEATRFSDEAVYSKQVTSPLPTYSNENQAAYSSVIETLGAGILTAQGKPNSTTLGSAVTIGEVNPTLEWEVPFYSNDRYLPGKTQDWTTSIKYGGSLFSVWADTEEDGVVDFYCAAGEDYVPYFWTGCPILYYEANPPSAP